MSTTSLKYTTIPPRQARKSILRAALLHNSPLNSNRRLKHPIHLATETAFATLSKS